MVRNGWVRYNWTYPAGFFVPWLTWISEHIFRRHASWPKRNSGHFPVKTRPFKRWQTPLDIQSYLLRRCGVWMVGVGGLKWSHLLFWGVTGCLGYVILCEPGSKLLVLGMGDLQPLIGNPYNGYINPYYWVDDHPLLYHTNRTIHDSECCTPCRIGGYEHTNMEIIGV